MTSWSLTATCSHCGQFGTVDDITLVCVRCGQIHDLTDEQRQAHDADLALQEIARARQDKPFVDRLHKRHEDERELYDRLGDEDEDEPYYDAANEGP